jgi:ATP-binding cassette subfamily F protein 3
VALNEFEGTLMLVSHDRALLRSVCDEFWLVGRGVVTDFDGDLDDYQRYLLDEAKRLREEAKVAVREAASAVAPAVAAPAPAAAESESAAASKNPQQRKQDAQGRQQRSDQAKPIKREIAQIDERLGAAGAERKALEARLAQPLPSAEIAEAGKRLKILNEEIGRLEERWLALSDQLEALAA